MAHPILEAQDALKAILDARAAWDTVTLRDGGPTEAEDITFDAFWFNDVTNIVQGWASLGAAAGGNRRRSTFSLGFTIACRLYGDDERAARARALALFEDFDLAIKANPSLSSTVQMVNEVTGTLGSAPPAPAQWGAWFTGSLAVVSRAY